MVFIALIGLAVTAAAAYQQYEQSKADAEYGQAMTEINNKAAMANYRRNLFKFSEIRVETRKASLGAQASLSTQYVAVKREFEGTYADNWGQSAEIYARQIAQRAGEDVEQIQQNRDRELERVNEAQEQARLDLTTQLKAAPPDQSKQALLSGLLSVGFKAAAIPSEISIRNDNDLIRRSQLDKLVDTSAQTRAAMPTPAGAGVIVAN